MINYLNRYVGPASPTIASLPEAELDEVRAIALKAELARTFSPNAPPQNQLLVGFAPLPSPPTGIHTAVYYTNEQLLNQLIQTFAPLPASLLSQTGLREFNLGSPKLAIYTGELVRNVDNDQPVNLIKVEHPQDDVDGKVRVQIVQNASTQAVSVSNYWLRKVDGKWQIVGFEPNEYFTTLSNG